MSGTAITWTRYECDELETINFSEIFFNFNHEQLLRPSACTVLKLTKIDESTFPTIEPLMLFGMRHINASSGTDQSSSFNLVLPLRCFAGQNELSNWKNEEGYLGNKIVMVNFKTPSNEFMLLSDISIQAFKKQDGGGGMGWTDLDQDRDM
jgi:hypothetical protein